MHTDRGMTKLTVTFYNSANMLKKDYFTRSTLAFPRCTLSIYVGCKFNTVSSQIYAGLMLEAWH